MSAKRKQNRAGAAAGQSEFRAGDIVAIHVEENLYAYAKLHRNHNIGLYGILSDRILDVARVSQAEIIWWTLCVANIVAAEDWTLIGHEEFASDEAAWAPPQYSYDDRFNIYWIWHKGERRRATQEETVGLHEHGCAFAVHVMEEIYRRLIGTVPVEKADD